MGHGAGVCHVYPLVPVPVRLKSRLDAENLAHDSLPMQQARIGSERALHHGINVVQIILREDAVRERINRIDQLIEEGNWGTGVLRTHGVMGGDIGSIDYSIF